MVNIYPVRDRNSKYEKLLNIEIPKFFTDAGTQISLLTDAIAKAPEVRRFLIQHDMFLSLTQYTSFRKRELPGLSFSGLTLKELLNGIVKVKRGAWIMRRAAGDNAHRSVAILL